MEKKMIDRELANSIENAVIGTQEDLEEEELSLSDLPLIDHSNSRKENNENNPLRDIETQDDFDFCSIISKEFQMCTADELFFQGQILPLRHSVSSDNGFRSVSKSECSLISTTTTRNQFHSYPSPSPKTRFPRNKQRFITTSNRSRINYKQKSPVWSIFRLGLVTAPPEIAFQDLKTRCSSNNNSTNCKNLGSRNSTSSNSSSFSSGEVKIINSDKRKKPRTLLLGGCKCSVNAVDIVPSKVVVFKRSTSGGEVQALKLEEENVQSPQLTKRQAARKQMAHHRTFEWLKQLSIEGTADR